ncbi:putative quinone oxidoreductase [Cystobasidium minutum MCA 4210]|uniref:putative quinone oxidoreductase n=1 Tax=Cystobasidium minutum MCA 4210 TaxID=1397322 RepID=UPI0034CF1972|eukprot:jgi/Rhomi1/184942/estExt_fgenesh1_pm.C_10280
MRAVIVNDKNKAKASSLSIGEIERPQVKDPKHALVQVKAFGLNRMDIMQRQGMYPVPPQAPATLGVEFSGIIEEAGNSSGWKKGDEVFGLTYGGAYAEYVLVDGGMLTSKPKELSWEQAAAIPEAWLTAFQALILIAEMKEGARVLIHAGASGVGIAAIQLAKGFGAKEVFTTAGSQEKLDFLTNKIGADHGINYKTQKFSDEILRITDKQGVDVIIDFVGQGYFEMNLQSAARDAHMVMLGLLSGGKVEGGLDLSTILYKRMRIEGTTLRSRSTEYQVDLLQRFSKEALPKVMQGHYELVIHKVLPWDKIVEATEILENSGNTGKVVCTI